MKLSISQQKTAEKIISIGRSMGKNDTQIRTALKVAYIESSFDGTKKNPNSSAKGLYQYLDAPWAERHQGKREDDEASIRAFYKDMQRFDNNYADHMNARKNDPESYAKRSQDRQVPADVSREDYIYVKHHDGPSASGDFFRSDSNMGKGINIYRARKVGPHGADEASNEVIKNYKPSENSNDKATTKQGEKPSATHNIFVHPYERRTGHVREHYRGRPDGDVGNNFSAVRRSGASSSQTVSLGYNEPSKEQKEKDKRAGIVVFY